MQDIIFLKGGEGALVEVELERVEDDAWITLYKEVITYSKMVVSHEFVVD